MRLILGFAVPMLLGILFQQLYSKMRRITLGRTSMLTGTAKSAAEQQGE